MEAASIPVKAPRASLLRQLGPGMPVQVIVPTQARTAFDYLVAPLRQSFRGALREM